MFAEAWITGEPDPRYPRRPSPQNRRGRQDVRPHHRMRQEIVLQAEGSQQDAMILVAAMNLLAAEAVEGHRQYRKVHQLHRSALRVSQAGYLKHPQMQLSIERAAVVLRFMQSPLG
ncbi:hypothetical protein [Rhizobium sp. NFR07]|uniref:hypothetical protein n=1 Tax=Rhizobium sp. NFR07 TaxID=1566262 RepID=UPI001FCDD526|nr:hypothetical protein [Rhizobium sp. NFR07]